jgi:hypothetical protein
MFEFMPDRCASGTRSRVVVACERPEEATLVSGSASTWLYEAVCRQNPGLAGKCGQRRRTPTRMPRL